VAAAIEPPHAGDEADWGVVSRRIGLDCGCQLTNDGHEVSPTRAWAALLGAALLALPSAALAAPNAPLPTPVDSVGDDLVQAFTGPSLLFYGGAVFATGVMAFGGADQAIRVGVQRNMDWPAVGDASVIAGYTLPVALAPTLYVIGLSANDRDLAGGGSAAVQALAVTVLTTGILKLATGRAYPLNGGDPRAPDRLDHPAYARSFLPFQRLDFPVLPAWPSGHTSACISVAASLTAYYPDQLWIPLVGYPVSVLIGFGLVVGDHHWASDVVAGALIGHAIGYSIGRSFRARVLGTQRSTGGITIVPLAGDSYGLALVGAW
jgi:membrane-associated phospholipid phosphatase